MAAGDVEWAIPTLIYATEDFGHVDFSVPRFAEFMRRYMPYESPGR